MATTIYKTPRFFTVNAISTDSFETIDEAKIEAQKRTNRDCDKDPYYVVKSVALAEAPIPEATVTDIS